MIYFDLILQTLTVLLGINIWLLAGGLIVFFLDDNHIYEHETHELLLMWFMFPIIIVLSLLENKDASKPDTEQS